MGIKIGVQKIVEQEVTELRIYTKVTDTFTASLVDGDGHIIKDYEGYVPPFMPGKHYGDYIILNINLETGVITNWSKPTEEELIEFLKAGE